MAHALTMDGAMVALTMNGNNPKGSSVARKTTFRHQGEAPQAGIGRDQRWAIIPPDL